MSIAREAAERHVREGYEIVARQRRLIERLQREDLPTSEAEKTLALFERSLLIFEADLELICVSEKR